MPSSPDCWLGEGMSLVIPFLLCGPPLLTFSDDFRVLKCSPGLFIPNQSGNITVEETGYFSIHLLCMLNEHFPAPPRIFCSPGIVLAAEFLFVLH